MNRETFCEILSRLHPFDLPRKLEDRELGHVLEEFEAALITMAATRIRQSQYAYQINYSRLARILKIDRITLASRIKKLKIDLPR